MTRVATSITVDGIGRSTAEVVEELRKEGIEPKVNIEKKSEKPKVEKPKVETGLVNVKDLEAEFGLKAKVIRRHLRKMEESTKERGPSRYEWETKSAELAAIRKNLKAIVNKKSA